MYGISSSKYVGPPYCRAEMYAGRVICCSLVSHGEYADGTDGQTPDRYIMLCAIDAASVINITESYHICRDLDREVERVSQVSESLLRFTAG